MPQLVTIQYLRAVAALMVVAYHIHPRLTSMGYEGPWPTTLKAGVDIFFVISGVIMWVTTVDRSTSPSQFYIKRILRIVPIYWAASIIPTILGYTTFWHIFSSYIFVASIHPVYDKIWPILIVGWTLNYEMFFYLLFGATLTLPARFRSVAISGSLITVFFIGLVFSLPPQLGFYTEGIILEFLAGVGIGLAWRAGMLPRLGLPGLVIGLATFGLLEDLPREVSLGVPAAIIVASALSLENRAPRYNFLQTLGNSSYSLYLFHGFALTILAKIWISLNFHWAAFVPMAMLVATAFGLVAYFTIEKPATTLSRRWLSRKSKPAARSLAA